MKSKSYEIDMTSGSLAGKIIRFALPLMLSSILQLLFNAADVIVVGRFVGHEALAAVGSTTALVNLFVNLFMGFSVSTNVLVARYFASNNRQGADDTVHTSVMFSLLCGGALILVGLFLAKPMLTLMGTPDDVLDMAALYIRVYFCGMPVVMLYNFGAAILRAVGDTKRPLYFLLAAGVLNVLINLFAVIVLHMGVAGVALATVISQALSAGLIVRCLMKSDGAYKLSLKRLRIVPSCLKTMIRIGLPAGMQGAIFSLSNVLIQSSINLFGSIAMAGSTAAANLEGFVYMSMNSLHQTSLSFTSQNFGAHKLDRIKRVLILCEVYVIILGLVMGVGVYLLGHQLLGIYSSDPEVISSGMIRLACICAPYFLCGMMDVAVGSLRGMGYSVMPMIVSLIGACGLRVVWIFTVFRMHQTLTTLYLSYPITWAITATTHLICFSVLYRKYVQNNSQSAVKSRA